MKRHGPRDSFQRSWTARDNAEGGGRGAGSRRLGEGTPLPGRFVMFAYGPGRHGLGPRAGS